jgi:hypothetical protein
MAKPESSDNRRVESLGCPVYGAEVTCKVTYHVADGKIDLTEFECNMEGMCGIPSWDPCPLYVSYLEAREN